MMVVPVPNFYLSYVKKEDARDILKRQRIGAAVVLIYTAIVLALMEFFVIPALFNVYLSLNQDYPWLILSAPYITAILVAGALISAIYLLLTKPNFAQIDAKARQYKDGEMIKASEFVDQRYQWFPLLFLFLAAVYIAVSIILPVSNLTAR